MSHNFCRLSRNGGGEGIPGNHMPIVSKSYFLPRDSASMALFMNLLHAVHV